MLETIVYLEWYDAQSMGDVSWQSHNDVEKWSTTPPPICKTVGFLLNETDKYIVVLFQSFDKPEEDDDDTQVGQAMKIPKAWLIHEQRFTPTKENK